MPVLTSRHGSSCHDGILIKVHWTALWALFYVHTNVHTSTHTHVHTHT